MPNLDMSCHGDEFDALPADDQQVVLCYALAKRWKKQDRLIASQRWGADEERRSIAAVAMQRGLGRSKTENRIEWIRDCVIESCVKVTTIYAYQND